jgi:hypothetical protein
MMRNAHSGSNKRHKEIMADEQLKEKIARLDRAGVTTQGLLTRFSMGQRTLKAIREENRLPNPGKTFVHCCPGDRP